MNDVPDYLTVQRVLEQNDIHVCPSEIHGVICGLLSGGIEVERNEYLNFLSDVLNEGASFGREVKTALADFYSLVAKGLAAENIQFELYLPKESDALSDSAQALVNWVAGFLLGFGLKQAGSGQFSDDVKEIIEDFTEITRLDTEFEDTKQDAEAFDEICEYVRVSTLLCFSELGRVNESAVNTSKTIH